MLYQSCRHEHKTDHIENVKKTYLRVKIMVDAYEVSTIIRIFAATNLKQHKTISIRLYDEEDG